MVTSARLATVLASLGFLAVPLCAQESRWGSPEDPNVKAMIAMESMWAASNCRIQPGLGDVIANDFQGTAPDGSRYGKTEAIVTDTTDLDRDCELGEVRIKFFGDSLALAYGSESSVGKDRTGKERKGCLAWTDTWLRRNEKWQIIAAQDTFVRCK